MNKYDIGEPVTLKATFKDDDEVVTDPTTIELKIQDPSGNVTTYTYALSEITKVSTGIYTKVIPVLDESGSWSYRWASTGAVASVEEGNFYVRTPKIAAS